jgi:uncharacterized membrane protein
VSRDLKVLERHFRHWRQEGLVSAELEGALRKSSDALVRASTGTVVRTALAALGGGLLLAGLVLIIAENWVALPRVVKLGGWAALHVAFLYASYHLGRSRPERTALAESLSFVAGGWVLAGIGLVSQIYQLDSRPPNGVWFWLALVLPAAWLSRRRAVSVVVFIALLTGLTLEMNEVDSIFHARQTEGPWIWIGIPLAAAWAVSWLPETASIIRGTAALWVFGAMTFFLLLFGATQEGDHSDLGRAWWIVGPAIVLAIAQPYRVLARSWDDLTSRLVLAASLVPWVLLGSQYQSDSWLDRLAVGVAWIVQLAVAVLVIRAGARSGSESWVNLGYLALLAGILTRYFDFFGDFLEGGVALVLTGVLVLFTLYALERARRRTLRRQASA